MHIRLLLITFFLQFFPDLIKKGHVYILQTPLFRVRNKKKTLYCYTEEERVNAIKELSPNPEITRFKGLGEISPDEFRALYRQRYASRTSIAAQNRHGKRTTRILHG